MRSNNDLVIQLTALRNSLQSEKSHDSCPIPIEGNKAGESTSFAATIREKDRQIERLRLELADLEVRMAEQTNDALSQTRQVEDALIQAKLENIRLAEDVESYQMLLQDRTLRGEYSIMGLEGVTEKDERTSDRSNSPPLDEQSKATSLATELEEAETTLDVDKVKGTCGV